MEVTPGTLTTPRREKHVSDMYGHIRIPRTHSEADIQLEKMPQIQKERAEGMGGTYGHSHSRDDMQTQSKIHKGPSGEKEGARLIEMKTGQRRDGEQNPQGGTDRGAHGG